MRRITLAVALVATVLAAVAAGSASSAGVSAARPAAQKPETDKAVFFAADGMRQDLVAKYAAQGLMPTMADVPQEGDVGVRQRPADPGAAEHRRRLVQPRDRRVAGRPRLDEQHVPHQRPAVRATAPRPSTRTCSRPSRSPSRPSAAASRSPRSSGPAAATPRSRARRSTSRRSSRAAAWRRTSSARRRRRCSTTRRSSRRSACSSTIPAGYAGQAPFPAPRRRRPPAGPAPAGVVQPGAGDAPARARLRRRQVRPERLHLRQHQRRHDELRQGAVLADEERRPTPSATWPRASGPTSRSTIQSAARSTARPPGMLVKVEELTGDLSRVRLFHTSVSRAIATLADLARRARLHRRLRRVPRPEVPDLDRRRLRDPRGRRHERGDLRRAGPVLGDRPRADARVRRRRPTSRTCCSSACRRPTSSSTSSSGSSRRSCPNGAPNPAYDDVDLERRRGRPRRRSARRSSGPPTRRPTRS